LLGEKREVLAWHIGEDAVESGLDRGHPARLLFAVASTTDVFVVLRRRCPSGRTSGPLTTRAAKVLPERVRIELTAWTEGVIVPGAAEKVWLP
jgi:hypothetical protein